MSDKKDCNTQQPHFHKTPKGTLVKCYHSCKSLFSWQFMVGMTAGFPLEHLLWTKVWPFFLVKDWFGL